MKKSGVQDTVTNILSALVVFMATLLSGYMFAMTNSGAGEVSAKISSAIVGKIIPDESKKYPEVVVVKKGFDLRDVDKIPPEIKDKIYEEKLSELYGEPVTLTEVSEIDVDYFNKEDCPEGKGELPNDRTIYNVPIDKNNSLGDYVPHNLVLISDILKTKNNRRLCLDETAAVHLKKMFDDLKKEGYEIMVTSAYRDPKTQLSLYSAGYLKRGSLGLKRIAPPESSEHNAGRAVDLSAVSINGESASAKFGDTPIYEWMAENAHKYGFIQSYPEGKEDVTGYMPEPWHWSFVGVENATTIKEAKITLHEALNDKRTVIVSEKKEFGNAAEKEEIAG